MAKTLTKTTSDTYSKCLERLDKMNINYKNTNISDLYKSISNIAVKNNNIISKSGIKLYLSAVLKYYKNNNSTLPIIKDISQHIANINKELNDKYYQNELNDKEKEVFLEWPEIVKAYDILHKGRNVSKTAFKKCVTIALYVLFPPRRLKDYSKMIIKNKEEDINNTTNYYIMSPIPKFIFNDFKTVGKFGTQEFDVPVELYTILNEYINMYSLVNHELIGLSETDLSEKIKRIFMGLVNKGITVNTLRHSYITYLTSNGDIKWTNQKIDLANKMAHSHHTQQDIYNKKT